MKNILILIFILLFENSAIKGQDILINNRYKIIIKDTLLSKNARVNNSFKQILQLLDKITDNDSLFDKTQGIDIKYNINFLSSQFNTNIYHKAQYLRFSSFRLGKNSSEVFTLMTVIEINLKKEYFTDIYNIIKNYPNDYFIVKFSNKFKYFKWDDSIYIIAIEGGVPAVFDDFYNLAVEYINSQ